MATVTIKNMPDTLYKIVKYRAKTHQRSLNSELIYCIQQSIGSMRVDPEKIRAQAKELRSRIKVQLTAEQIEAAIKEGRK